MFAFARKRDFDDELGAPRKKRVVKKKPRQIYNSQFDPNESSVSEANNAALGATTRNRALGNNSSTRSTSQTTISLFTFGWTGVSKKDTYTSFGSLKEYHARFNKKIVSAFPKLDTANPFTSYTDRSGGGYIAESQITATAETNLSPNATRAKVIQLAKDAGFTGDLARVEFSQKTIKQIRNGENLVQPKSTVNPNTITRTRNPNTNTNANANPNADVIPTGNAPGGFMDAIFGDGFGGNLGSALGLSTPVVILIAVVIGIIILKK